MISRSTDIKAALRSKQRGFLLNPFRFGAAGDPPTDPLWDKTVVLLHFDSGSSTFLDNSAFGANFSSYSGAATSTSQSLFGGASAYLAGNGPFIFRTLASAYFIGTRDFSIEMAFRPNSLMNSGTTSRFAGVWQSGNLSWILYYTGGSINFYVPVSQSNSTVAAFLSHTMDFPANTWQRVAVCGNSSSIFMLINGVLVDTETRVNIPENGNLLAFGGINTIEASSNTFPGYIDEVRFTVGTGACRYTADYTLRGSAFPNSA